MKDGINLFGTIEAGKLNIDNREALQRWIETLKEGSNVVIKLRDQKQYFSHRQLRLIYSQFRAISLHTGYSIEDVKTILKMHYGYCYSHTLEGKEVTICKSISDFNKSELSIFIEEIERWASQKLGLKLLTSDDLSFLHGLKT